MLPSMSGDISNVPCCDDMSPSVYVSLGAEGDISSQRGTFDMSPSISGNIYIISHGYYRILKNCKILGIKFLYSEVVQAFVLKLGI
jgi:hypothetical protein